MGLGEGANFYFRWGTKNWVFRIIVYVPVWTKLSVNLLYTLTMPIILSIYTILEICGFPTLTLWVTFLFVLLYFVCFSFPQPRTLPGSNSTITPGLGIAGVVFSSLGLGLPVLLLAIIICMCSIFLCCESCVESCEYCVKSCQHCTEDHIRDAGNSMHDARRRRQKTKGWKPCLTHLHGYSF